MEIYFSRGLQHVLLLLMVSEVTSLSLNQVNEEWTLFKSKFDRTFTTTEEENYRYSVFAENLKTIFLHNMAADKGHYSYWLGINNFADLTGKEFEKKYTGLKIKPMPKRTNANITESYLYDLMALPKSVDWRKMNCVTRVKFQGQCGSCYAFAATGALEGRTCIKTGKLVSLSEQNIIDCTEQKPYLNQGCIGGQADSAFDYVIMNGGIDTEKSYPYEGKVNAKCEFKKDSIGATAKDYKSIQFGNEFALQIAVSHGPVSVCIASKGLQLYQHGVYDGMSVTDESKCSSLDVNHAMLAIGYGKSQDGRNYWLLKNSWSEGWGEDGYMRLVKNMKNRCGITTLASYPEV